MIQLIETVPKKMAWKSSQKKKRKEEYGLEISNAGVSLDSSLEARMYIWRAKAVPRLQFDNICFCKQEHQIFLLLLLPYSCTIQLQNLVIDFDSMELQPVDKLRKQ